MKIIKPDKKKKFCVLLANFVLQNLSPAGRSALYASQDKKNLANRVENINPKTDLYKILGINKNTSKDDLEKAYKNKIAKLESKKEKTEEEKKELEKNRYAYRVLSDPSYRQIYDKTKIEPTVIADLVNQNILYVYIKKISPTTVEELKRETKKFNNVNGLNTLILDLRKNVGGAIDVLPYLLGPFIGQNQYAYEFLHQGKITPFKTKIGWLPSLVRYKKVVILIDNQTQSSAEIMASTLKKYNVGVLVGVKTKGWGTIESVIDIKNQIDKKEKYSIFLVNSLTLRNDGKPIEGNGVEPTIYITDADWKKQLFAYFHYDELAKAIEKIWNTDPGLF